jgi:23S rRNA pseudouridine2605 synthase
MERFLVRRKFAIEKKFLPPIEGKMNGDGSVDGAGGIRLQKFLADCGVCSRRRGEEHIVQGDVLVDGKPAALGMRVFPHSVVTHRGEVVEPPKIFRRIVLALHKPPGYACTHGDPSHPAPTIYDLLPLYKNRKLICCGRLDKDSTGLVILSNDGALAAQLMHPTHQISKAYRVAISKPLEERHRGDLLRGIHDGQETLHLQRLTLLSRDRRILAMELGEGKKRHIRRMLEALGYGVVHLERHRIGGFMLGRLKMGRYRELDGKQCRRLLMDSPEAVTRSFRRGAHRTGGGEMTP